MNIFRKLVALPVHVVNAPIRAMETLVNGGEKPPEDDRFFSKPLDILADEIEGED